MTPIAAKELPRAIRLGWRTLSKLVGCDPLVGFAFHAGTGKWVAQVRLSIEKSGGGISRRTRWYVLVDETYPFGDVKFYPPVYGGMPLTFPHQERNELRIDHNGWGRGKLCLDTPIGKERGKAVVRDPIGDDENRLRWHAERALAWLAAASKGLLLPEGDPFETPAHPSPSGDIKPFSSVVHDETPRTFNAWEKYSRSQGKTEFSIIPGLPKVLAANFKNMQGAPIRAWEGRDGGPPEQSISGYWWIWPKPIVVPPWHCPGTWGELRRAGRSMGLDVNKGLDPLIEEIRGKDGPVLLMLGFPMPRLIGQCPCEIYWQTIVLPRVPIAQAGPDRQRWTRKKTVKGKKPPKGFRQTAQDNGNLLRHRYFQDDQKLHFLPTLNWSGERLQARGRLPIPLIESRIAIVGVGAMGSIIAELLVREGLRNIAIIDHDVITHGNICRHTATLLDCKKDKVTVVAKRLEEISPLVKIVSIASPISINGISVKELLDPYSIVIDCTASDMVIASLRKEWWPIPKLFASFSLGFEGKRLFSFGSSGNFFPEDTFMEHLKPWLARDAHDWEQSGEVMEGIGCWSPLFPARYDDVIMAAAVCIKELERMISTKPLPSTFRVFSQVHNDQGFNAIALELG